jgi:hypothetical protein
MDINKSYELAVQLGFAKGSKCHVNLDKDGKETFWWNGLQIPKEHVTVIDTDPRCSGRYPWYLTMESGNES